ncbi:Uncharacterised protein [Mycobacterium tuberculosis]|nr:Uncharacterised protein [Mycobacterium tuberculosis]CNN59614.1 Uncharacterised protein [Mycobacterium tuberculosis]
MAASESTSTIRPGCSVCADRTNPHTAAPAKSVTSSPGNATAPRVITTKTPAPSRVSHDCNTSSTELVAAYTPATTSPARGTDSNTTAAESSVVPQAHTGSGSTAADGCGDQVTSNSRSGPELDTAARNC